MASEQSHYHILGVSPDASEEEIEAQLWRLADRAMALSHTASSQADELWIRIRRIRRDLLSGADRRQAYDAELRRAAAPPIEDPIAAPVNAPRPSDLDELLWFARASAEMNQAQHGIEPETVIASRAVRPRPAAAPSSRYEPEPNRPRRAFGAGAAAVAMLLIAALLVQPWQWHFGGTTPARPLAVSSSGSHPGSSYASGQNILLHWSRADRNSVYELQLARTRQVTRPRVALVTPFRTVFTRGRSYTFRAEGAEFYYWHVRVGRTGPWSKPQVLAVAAPRVGTPEILTPANRSTRRPGRTKLCWSSVPGAVGYPVRLDAATHTVTHGTCFTATLRPGTHRWTVAALMRAARVYRGKYAPVVRFAVHAPVHHAVHRARSHAKRAITVVRVVVVHRVKTGASRASHAPAPMKPTIVYLAPPSSLAYLPMGHRRSRTSRSRQTAAARAVGTRRARILISRRPVALGHRPRAGRPAATHLAPSPIAPPPPPPIPTAPVAPVQVTSPGAAAQQAPAPTTVAAPQRPTSPSPAPIYWAP